MKLAASMARLGTESAFEVLAKARALEAKGKNIVHLEIGQPDFPTPQHVREAGKKAIDDGWTGYGPTAGFPDFRRDCRLHLGDAEDFCFGFERRRGAWRE